MTKEQLIAVWGVDLYAECDSIASEITERYPSPIHGNTVQPDLVLAVAIKKALDGLKNDKDE